MDYTVEMADRIAEKLRKLPPVDPSQARLNKQGVVRHLAGEIAALQERGYTLEQIAESLRGSGLEITTPTLKSYLQRSKRNRARPRRKAPPGQAAQPAPAPQPSRPGPAREAPRGGPEAPPNAPKSTKSEFITADRQKL